MQEFTLENRTTQRHKLGLMTVSEAARALDITLDRLKWFQRSGQIDSPAARIAGRSRAYYTTEDLSRLRLFFKQKTNLNSN